MFDFAWSEIMLIGIVGLIFIGPKDMPTAIRAITDLLKKGRKLAGEFQTHVDEMVRDADLGEARDSLRQLRSMNLRGQVMKALDGDGSIRRTLVENPLSPIPAASSAAIPGVPPATPVIAGGDAMVAGPPLLHGGHAGYRATPGAADGAAAEDALAEIDDPAPNLIPPEAARRLRRLRAAEPAPAFLPPGTIRPASHLY